MVPPRRQLNEQAAKRLQAVKEFARLGSGYKIAMRDLTIRGAGDLLGENQSGFIDTVGIDMYIEMLEEAIARQKGEVKQVEAPRRHAMTSQSSYIPEHFAPDDYDKISMYQKIDALTDMDALEEYRKEVVDQYGRLPQEVKALFEKKKLDILLNDPDVDSYKEIKGKPQVTFSQLFSQNVDGVKLFQIFSQISKDIDLRYTGGRIIAYLPEGKNALSMAITVMTRAKEAKKHAG